MARSLQTTLLFLLLSLAGAVLFAWLDDFVIRPGPSFEAFIDYHYPATGGRTSIHDLDRDGRGDFLTAYSSNQGRPAHITVRTSSSRGPREDREYTLRNAISCGYPLAVDVDSSTTLILVLSASSDSSSLGIEQFQWGGDKVLHHELPASILPPAGHPLPNLQAGICTLNRMQRTWIAVSMNSPSGVAWRGSLLIDPSGQEPPALVPRGLPAEVAQGNLVQHDGLEWLAYRHVSAVQNGNRTGGIADSCAAVLLFQPETLEQRAFYTGSLDKQLTVLGLPEDESVLVCNPYGIRMTDGATCHLLQLDLRDGQPGKTMRVENAHHFLFTLDSQVVLMTMMSELLRYDPARNLLEPWLQLPSSVSSLRGLVPWIQSHDRDGRTSFFDHDGRLLCTAPEPGRLFISDFAPRDAPHLAQATLACYTGSSYINYAFRKRSMLVRLLGSPGLLWGALAGLGLFAGWLVLQLRRQDRLILSLVDDELAAAAILHPDGRFQFQNRRFRELMNREELQSCISGVQENNTPWPDRIVLEGVNYQLRSRPLHQDGRTQGHLLVLRDLTDRIAAERAQEFKSLARVSSHELSNSMTPIRMSLDQVRIFMAEHEQDFPESLRAALERAGESQHRLQQMIRQFMHLSRGEITRAPVDLLSLMETETHKVIKARAAECTVSLEAPDDLPAIRGQHEMLAFAVSSLVNNSLDAMGEAGQLRVRLNCAEARMQVWITDSGPGFDESEKDLLLSPGHSGKTGGTGYGLFFAKEIMTLHGGSLDLRNETDAGGHILGCSVLLEFPLLQQDTKS